MATEKNICITINSIGRGGAEKQCLLLAKALMPFHNVVLVILNARPSYQPRLAFLEEEGLDHNFLPKNPIKKIIHFTRLLKKRKIEIIFSFLPKDTFFATMCGRAVGVPYIFGGIRNSYIPWIKLLILRTIHNKLLYYTISNNYAAYNSSIEFGFNKKVMVVHNGIEIRPLIQDENRDKKTVTIISLGRLVKQKDYETAIRSIAELKRKLKRGYKLKYRIVGQGPERERILASIEKYAVHKEVELILYPSNIYELLESSDIYLCTSTFEGISNSIMEAMNCALPIVATDVGDNSYLVANGKNGFLTARDDYKNIAQHLNDFVESPSLRRQMGLESYHHLVENFSYHTFQKKYLSLIKNMETIQIDNGKYLQQEGNSCHIE